MFLNETDLTAIRVPVVIHDLVGALATGVTATGTQLQISINGAAFVNATGTLVEVGAGAYYYQGVLTDASTEGFILIKIANPAFNTELVWDAVIGTTPLIRIPMALFDSATGALKPGVVPVGAELQISVDGVAFTAATGTFTEIGSGAYYYAHNSAPPGFILIKIVKTGVQTSIAFGETDVRVAPSFGTTTSELVLRAKAAADIRDNFVTPTQWMYWATQEREALELYLARSGWAIPFESFTITPTGHESGKYLVNPSTGVMAIVAVHELKDNRYRRLKYQDNINFMRQVPGTTSGAQGHGRYFRASWSGANLTLNINPEPQVGETYVVTYIPHPAKLTLSAIPTQNTATGVQYPMGWEERIVLGMAKRALIKEESSTSAIDEEIRLWDRRIEEACWNRVMGESPSVRNGDNENYGWNDRISWPPYSNSWFWA